MATPMASDSANAFLIRIKGGTHFRGTKPFIVTCLDNELSNELHRTRAVDGARFVAWNEAFVVDISKYCQTQHSQPQHLTFVFIDANKAGMSSLGYVQLSLQNIRSSELEEVTENIRGGKGTITFSTTPVKQKGSVLSQYAEHVKGYFYSIFDANTSDAPASNQAETVFVRAADSVKGVAASAKETAQSKLSSVRGQKDSAANAVEDRSADVDCSKAGASEGATTPSRLGAVQHLVHTNVQQTKQAFGKLVDKVRPSEKNEQKQGGASEPSNTDGAEGPSTPSRLGAVEDMVQTKVAHTKEGLAKMAERVKGRGATDEKQGETESPPSGESAVSGSDAKQSAHSSRLDAAETMMHTKVEQAKEGIAKALDRVKAGKATGEPAGDLSDATSTNDENDKQSRLSAAGDLLHSRIEQTKEEVAKVMERAKAHEKGEVSKDASDLGGASSAVEDGDAGVKQSAATSRKESIQHVVETKVEQAKHGMWKLFEKAKQDKQDFLSKDDGGGDSAKPSSTTLVRRKTDGDKADDKVSDTGDGEVQ